MFHNVLFLSPFITGLMTAQIKMKEEQSSNVKITLFTTDIHKCFIETFEEEALNCTF